MSPLPIYSALNVPTVASCPSATCLQWSGDGQVCFVTKASVYILTPDYGICTSVVKAPIDKKNSHDKPIGWFRTMIEFDKRHAHHWPESSQEWGAAALGSLDIGLRAVACSPSNLSDNAGCILAVLSSNMDLSLWAAAKNSLKGEWVKIHEVTPFLTNLFSQEQNQSAAAKTLQAQITSLAWSPQADFGIAPAPSLDGSLLIAGNRAGALIFLRFCGKSTIYHLDTVKVVDQWLTHLAFSPWILTKLGRCEAKLAYGSSDGSIGLVTIVQSLEQTAPASGFGPEYSIKVRMEDQSERLYEADRRGITALTWVVARGNVILVHCKPGAVYLWSPDSSTLDWSGYRRLTLETYKLSVGSSSLQPVSGLHYVRRKDALIVSLFDGSIHVIHSVSREPSWASPVSGDNLTSQNLSDVSRSIFTQAESGKTDDSDVNRISGLISYDGFATVLWAHEYAILSLTAFVDYVAVILISKKGLPTSRL